MKRRHVLAGGLAFTDLPEVAKAQATGSGLMDPHIVELVEPFPPGEVHVFPGPFRLFWTLEDGMGWGYPIRVGRDGPYEAGEYFVGAKKEWPS